MNVAGDTGVFDLFFDLLTASSDHLSSAESSGGLTGAVVSAVSWAGIGSPGGPVAARWQCLADFWLSDVNRVLRPFKDITAHVVLVPGLGRLGFAWVNAWKKGGKYFF